ncbi:MAG: hypothetical protein HQL30_07050 [Candidatus Omnitrophica bacterium]|nr:hypothetical protein [Candidatus Omnitrophota bacterium]
MKSKWIMVVFLLLVLAVSMNAYAADNATQPAAAAPTAPAVKAAPAAVAPAAVAPAAVAPVAAEDDAYTGAAEDDRIYVFGEVTNVAANAVTVAEKEYDAETDQEKTVEYVFTTNEKTEIDGKASLAEFVKGDDVYVEYVKEGDKNIAVYVSLE